MYSQERGTKQMGKSNCSSNKREQAAATIHHNNINKDELMQHHNLKTTVLNVICSLVALASGAAHAEDTGRQIAPSQTVRGALTPVYIGNTERVYRICGSEPSKSNLNSNLDIYVEGSVVYKLPIGRARLCVDISGRKIEIIAEDQTYFTYEALRQ
jgi:hypothetical protein